MSRFRPPFLPLLKEGSPLFLPLLLLLPFLSAAQPTDQGEESVVLLLGGVVVGGGDHFSVSHVQFFGV